MCVCARAPPQTIDVYSTTVLPEVCGDVSPEFVWTPVLSLPTLGLSTWACKILAAGLVTSSSSTIPDGTVAYVCERAGTGGGVKKRSPSAQKRKAEGEMDGGGTLKHFFAPK